MDPWLTSKLLILARLIILGFRITYNSSYMVLKGIDRSSWKMRHLHINFLMLTDQR
jgi:hypothetical protein